MQNYILRFLKEISCVRLQQWCRLAKTGKNNYAVALVFNMQCPDIRRSPRFVFLWAYSAQTVRPPPKLTYKRHILGMSTSPRNDSHRPQLCRLSCTPLTSTPPSTVPILAVLGTWKTPSQKFVNFAPFTHARTNSRLLFQNWSKSVQDKWPKDHLLLLTERKQNLFWHH